MADKIISSPNTELLQDELLYDVIHVIENKYPISPAFIHTLSTLVEAAVLHETNYYNVGWDALQDGQGLDNIVHKSEFVQRLVAEGVLSRFPTKKTVERRLSELEAGYNYLRFLADQFWTTASFSSTDITQQKHHLSRIATLLTDFPGVLRTKGLTDAYDLPVEGDAKRLFELGSP